MRQAEKRDFVPRFVPRFALRYPTNRALVQVVVAVLHPPMAYLVFLLVLVVLVGGWLKDAPTGCGAGLFSVKCWRHKKMR